MKKIEEYRKFIFIGIVVIALGITFSTSLKETLSSLGNVLVALGGLFLIFGMSKKKKGEKDKEQ